MKWYWLAAGGAAAWWLYKRQPQQQVIIEEEVVEPIEGGIVEGVGGYLQADMLPKLQASAAKLIRAINARMPWMRIEVPKTITRAVVHELNADMYDILNGCFGPREWQEFVFGPYQVPPKRKQESQAYNDKRALVMMEAFRSFFETDTGALKDFLRCMRASYGPADDMLADSQPIPLPTPDGAMLPGGPLMVVEESPSTRFVVDPRRRIPGRPGDIIP